MPFVPRDPGDAAQFVDATMAGKPELIVHGGDLPATARALRDLFATAGHLFDRDMPIKLVEPADGGPMMASPLTVSGIVMEAHRLCQPVKLGPEGERIPVTLPERVGRMFLEMRGEWNLPPLAGITTTPLFSPCGTFGTLPDMTKKAGCGVVRCRP